MEEYILCAANHYNDKEKHVGQPINIKEGYVIYGRRHNNCIGIFAKIVRFPYDENALIIRKTEIQGFITNTNRFVTRQEAYKIAFKANQIIGPNKDREINEIGLTSEDLY